MHFCDNSNQTYFTVVGPSVATLRVIYTSGMVYHYKNVPEEVFTAMKTSFSKGAFLNQYVKGKYAYEKIKE